VRIRSRRVKTKGEVLSGLFRPKNTTFESKFLEGGARANSQGEPERKTRGSKRTKKKSGHFFRPNKGREDEGSRQWGRIARWECETGKYRTEGTREKGKKNKPAETPPLCRRGREPAVPEKKRQPASLRAPRAFRQSLNEETKTLKTWNTGDFGLQPVHRWALKNDSDKRSIRQKRTKNKSSRKREKKRKTEVEKKKKSE